MRSQRSNPSLATAGGDSTALRGPTFVPRCAAERLLAAPFRMHWRPRPADNFASREGFFMFRVHGATFLGRWYRVLVILLNIVFGSLSGLQPLLPAGTPGATAQTAIIGSLQLIMAAICFLVLPDADRIFSRFAATQFLTEGLSTLALLAASLSVDRPGDALQDLGFWLALGAMVVPMVQLLEQRLVTPAIGIVRSRGVGSPLALLATVYMLAASLRRKIANMVVAIAAQDDMGIDNAAGAASADAGDDAVEVEYEDNSNADGGDPSADKDGAERERGGPSERPAGLQAEQVADAGLRVTRLMGRAMAAKEAGGKAIAQSAPKQEEEEEELDDATTSGLQGMHAVARFRHRMLRRQDEGAMDDEIDDGGADD